MKISDGMIQKLDKIEARCNEVGQLLSMPENISDQEKFKALSKEHSDLMPICEIYSVYKKHKSDFEDCESMAAALFGTELMKMYRHYAENNRWKVEEVNMNYTELGGAKELVFMITGKGVWGKLKFESGVHRVQRVPETESQGRVHTSTVTVAVLPEAQNVEVNLNENDIKVDTYRSGGAGGQHVNKTESAIRMTHIPTGIVVECQDERSQIKNREKALKVLKSRVYDFYQSQAEKEYAENRRAQVGTGDRSERIRTYNFPQGRVTDHRIGLTLYNIDKFMLGDLDEMISALQIAVQNKMLENIE